MGHPVSQAQTKHRSKSNLKGNSHVEFATSGSGLCPASRKHALQGSGTVL